MGQEGGGVRKGVGPGRRWVQEGVGQEVGGARKEVGHLVVPFSQTTLARIQENTSNKVCADCESTEPVWGVINKGIMVCINCSGK